LDCLPAHHTGSYLCDVWVSTDNIVNPRMGWDILSRSAYQGNRFLAGDPGGSTLDQHFDSFSGTLDCNGDYRDQPAAGAHGVAETYISHDDCYARGFCALTFGYNR